MKKNHKIIFLLAAWLALFFHPDLHAQTFAVKTNLLSDLTASPELAVETACSRRWSIGLSGNYCGWDPLPEKKFRHWAVRSEGRYWFCEKFNGHFVSLHALGGEYNVAGYGRALSLYPAGRGSRRQGWLAGQTEVYVCSATFRQILDSGNTGKVFVMTARTPGG